MNRERFRKVLGKKEVFTLGFGAMIGWGWIVMVSEWINTAGSVGSILAFIIGGILIMFIGIIYSELIAAMPDCGGEHVYSLRALGYSGSFLCTWAIILGYVGVVAFEACAFPTVLQYLFPGFKYGYLYTIAGYDVYLSWVLTGIIVAVIITILNCMGIQSAAKVQNILVMIIAAVGILLIIGAALKGEVNNMYPLFNENSGGVLKVALMTPFMLVGFDVIPQAAEEINIPVQKIGRVVLASICGAVIWYIAIIVAISLILSQSELYSAQLIAADAMKKAFFNSELMGASVIVGGIAGIITSWNSFMVGGSRAIFSMAESNMLPIFFTRLSEKKKTPYNAVLFIGLISCIAPFFGRQALVWLTNAGSFGVVFAYFLVAVSFCVLRIKEPRMERPFKIKHWKVVGGIGIIASTAITILYIPGMPSGLAREEIIIIGVWSIIGGICYVWSKFKVGVKGGRSIHGI